MSEIDLVLVSAVCQRSNKEGDVSSLKAEIRDLSSRLYYCSNSGEGRKMRKWIEQRIRALEKVLAGIEAI